MWRPILARALVLWVPLAAATTGICGLIYVADLNGIRSAANDPQIQLVEDGVTSLDGGAPPASVVPSTAVDLSSSLQPYLVVFDAAGHPVASSVTLHGRQPDFPPSVFDAVRGGGQDRITWQPEPGVRSAVVVERWRGGFVLAGRSLRLAEERETDLEVLVVLGWLGTLTLTALAAIVVGIFHPLRGPTTQGAGDGNGDDGPPGDGPGPSGPGHKRAGLFGRGVARSRVGRPRSRDRVESSAP